MPEIPTTNTLLYFCAGAGDASGVDGLRSPEDGLFEELEEAERQCGDRILVVDAYAVERRGAGGAVLNAAPYLPPAAVTAAGGFVTRRTTQGLELLLIRRRGAWDLPKGKLEAGESIEACALREVREELGVDEISLGRPLGRTIHGYPDGPRYAVKTTSWFEMTTRSNDFHPQSDEDIEEVAWVAWNEARERLGYESLRRHTERVRPLVDSSPGPHRGGSA